jgi:hypothetical protein
MLWVHAFHLNVPSIFFNFLGYIQDVVQNKLMYPQHAHWAYAGNILQTCVDNIWNVLGGYIWKHDKVFILAVNEMLPMGTFGAHIQITFQM